MFIPAPNTQAIETNASSRGAGPPTRGKGHPSRYRGRLLRLGKYGVAVLAVGAGALAEGGDLVSLQSASAIVSAPLVVVRAPIAGVVTDGGARSGQVLAAGSVVARIADPLASLIPVETLQAQATELKAELSATSQRREALVRMHDNLLQRASAHGRLVAARLDSEITSADETLAASQARDEQARRDLQRRRTLAAAGDVPLADLERSQTAVEAGSHEQAGQRAIRQSLVIQRAAAAAGMFAEPGVNETTYAAQRADEIALRLIDLDQSTANLTAELARTQALASAAAAEWSAHAQAVITAPITAVQWQGGAAPGDYVTAGEAIAELVACDQAVIVAAVAQRDLAAVVVGGDAAIRLDGEAADRHGQVIERLPEAAVAGDPRLAVIPAFGKVPSAVVLISLPQVEPPAGAPPASHECLVGRNARVVLPRVENSLLRRAINWLM